jgi:uncharacterized protein DUF3560
MTRRERLARKLERRGEWAEKANARSAAAFDSAGQMASGIPFGQPILVGHHSEKRDRNYRAKIHAKMDRGLAESKLADHHESKAAGLAIALERSIFDDDPDAIERLGQKVAELEQACEKAKRVNAVWRKGGQAAVAAEFSQALAATVAETMRQCRWLRAPMTTTNDRAEIRRCKQRIELISKQRARAAQAEQAGGVSITRHDLMSGDRWAVVTFAEKPDRSVLNDLRAAGYRWGKGSWQGYESKLPESVQELASRAEEERKAERGECLCSPADGYECVPCENDRVAEEPEEQEQQAS